MPRWLVLLGALTAITSLSVDMYLPGFPAIASGLGTDSAHVERTLSAFLLGMAAGQLLYGPLSDRFGRKPPLYVGLAIYIGAALGCAQAGSVLGLTAWRLVQALGGSAATVITRAIIRDRTTTLEGVRAFSLLMLIMGASPILAPLFGGVILQLAGWRAIFVVLAVFGTLLLLGARFSLRETLPPHDRPPLRLGRMARQYAALAYDRPFVRYTLSRGLASAGMLAYLTGAPRVLIGFYGVPPQDFGWLFGLNAAGLIAASQVNARFAANWGAHRTMSRGVRALPLAALIGLVPALLGVRSLAVLMFGLFVYISALGFIGPNATGLALAGQKQQVAGSASALMGTLSFLLGTLAGAAMSLWPVTSAIPLMATMLVCGLLSCGLFYLLPGEVREREAKGEGVA